MFCNILLPSGIVDPREVKMSIVESGSKLKIVIAMPNIMENSYLLHRDTFASKFPTTMEINQNLRVAMYNNALEAIQPVKGEKVWWTAFINLSAVASSNKFLQEKYLNDPTMHAIVACVDMLVEDSSYLQEKKKIETIGY